VPHETGVNPCGIAPLVNVASRREFLHGEPPGPTGVEFPADLGTVRLEIHVRPSASSTAVGGEYDGVLVVRVVEPPEAGRATEAAIGAVAEAIAVPRRSVKLVRGATSRRKLLEIEAHRTEPQRIAELVERLRGGTGDH